MRPEIHQELRHTSVILTQELPTPPCDPRARPPCQAFAKEQGVAEDLVNAALATRAKWAHREHRKRVHLRLLMYQQYTDLDTLSADLKEGEEVRQLSSRFWATFICCSVYGAGCLEVS